MKNFVVTVNGVSYNVSVEEVNADEAASSNPVQAPAAVKPAPAKKPAAAVGKTGSVVIKAPMPGNIIKIGVNAGDSVKKGAVLCILEAMKMENEIMAPQDGVVVSVNVKKGDSVATDAVLVTLN